MTDIQIKSVSLDPLDDVARLFEASIEDHRRRVDGVMKPNYDWRKETKLRLEREYCRFLVAYVDGQAVGLQTVHYSPWRKKKNLMHRIRRRFVANPTGPFIRKKIGTLTDIYVDPDFRGRGIGRALVKAAIEMLEEAGADQIYLDVIEGNDKMLGLAKSMGFEPRMIRLRRKLG